MSAPLADVLHDLSIRSRLRLTAARTHGWDLREETVTETLILDLLNLAGNATKIHKTSVAEENANGPDWLWALQIRGMWLTLWVQAKKGSGGRTIEYQSLSGKAAREQALRLLLNAEANDAVPVYAFFNPEGDPFLPGSNLDYGRCTRRTLLHADDGLPWKAHTSPSGVTVADAIEVAQHAIFGTRTKRRQAAMVNSYAMPWECLVCPTRVQKAGSLSRASAPATRTLLRAIEFLLLEPDDEPTARLPRGTSKAMPDWAARLSAGGDPFTDLSPGQIPSHAVVTYADDIAVIPDSRN